jgi:hypothetical protein
MTETPPPLPPFESPKGSCLRKGLVVTVILLVVAGLFLWWQNRPIRAVTLKPAEQAAVDAKIEMLQGSAEREDAPVATPAPIYEKGSREILLTERELNGLLNQHTQLGDSLQFELADGAIHARVETDLANDLPLVGGRRLKARARFLVGNDGGRPSLVIDDLTVWGVSLPNDWLAGMKGQDLLGEVLGGESGELPGVEEFKVERGKLLIRLKE